MCERYGDLTEDILLILMLSGVPHADRRRISVTWQPWNLPVGDVALASDAIHDLDLGDASPDRT